MIFKCLWVSLLLFLSVSVSFKSSLKHSGKRCFMEVFDQDQKYNVDVLPLSTQEYQLEITVEEGESEEEKHIFTYAATSQEPVYVHKIAEVSGLYKICLKNQDKKHNLVYEMKIKSGIDLMDLHILPDSSDAENLNKELKWLEDNKEVLRTVVDKSHSAHTSIIENSTGLNSELGLITMILTGIVVGLNVLFYVKFKQTMRQRKLI